MILTQALDFNAESDLLHDLLKDRDNSDFDRVTLFRNWSVNDVLGHLHMWNHAADLSATNEAGFREFLSAFGAAGAQHFPYTHEWSGGLKGQALLDAWRELYSDMARRWQSFDPEKRVKWAGPDMSVQMSIVARHMETWAHGQEVFDLFGVRRQDEDRIRNIVDLGVRTFGWTFANRQIDRPPIKPFVELTAPSGATWRWNDESDRDYIKGAATDFCQVVTQTRSVADVALDIAGVSARQWMAIAQCFAGPPVDPPAPGMRFCAPPTSDSTAGSC
ncbi:MAG: TIGR03084 family metal-binding protein [Rhodospirillaceae bacterium]|nr:TIGR03084 family metal-binding protein [Rhodospirillaceae bacterium]